MSDPQKRDLLLAIDVGNTNTQFGLLANGNVLADFRMETRRHRTYDEYWALMDPLLKRQGIEWERVNQVVISCVVPPALMPLAHLATMATGKEPLVVDHRLDTGLKLLYHRPEEMGADRVVNAAYAHHRWGAAIVVDFGTATTLDVVNDQGEYLGGCIVPGVSISMDALFMHASRLPRIEVERPDHVIGRSTEEAMRSGVYFGYVSMVDGLVERMRKEAGIVGRVIATGGLASRVHGDSRTVDEVLPELPLLGMAWLATRHETMQKA